MFAPSVFEFLYAATTLLVIAVLFRRLRALEAELEEAADANREPGQAANAPPAMPPAACPDAGVPLADLLLSPITVILGQCELARAEGRADARLDVVERHARRVADLLRRPGAAAGHGHGWAARTADAPASPEARRLDPRTCVRAAVDGQAELALERGVTVHLELDDAPPIRANPFLLSHALRHLVRAAIEAAPHGSGDVTVAVGELYGEVLFAVADDGPGLGAEQLAAIFDPGLRAGATWGAEALAYSVVHAVSQALGATFVLDTAPGAGTRATIRMPVAATLSPLADAGPDQSVESVTSERSRVRS